MNKLVIFDLDGTLLDSLPDIYDNINLMLKKFGYPSRKREEVMQFIGNGARNLVKRSIPDGMSEEQIDKCLTYYNEIYTNSGSPKTKLFDGIRETVVELKNRGYKLAILTNKPQITTDRIYEEYMMDLGFDVVIGQRNGVKIKPDPITALKIIEELESSPENTYFVGDGETDVETSINANTCGIAVLWGYRNRAQLEKAGAKVFVNAPKELLSVIL